MSEPLNKPASMIQRVSTGMPLADNGNGAEAVTDKPAATQIATDFLNAAAMANPFIALVRDIQTAISSAGDTAVSKMREAMNLQIEEAPQQILDALGIDPKSIIDNLVGLPSAINSTAKQIASLRSDMHKREDDLKALEIPQLYAANEQGKNVEQRKLLFDEACAKDAGIIEKRKVIAALDQQIKGLEADRDMFMEQSRNYRAVSRMLCSYLDRSPVSNGGGE